MHVFMILGDFVRYNPEKIRKTKTYSANAANNWSNNGRDSLTTLREVTVQQSLF